MNDCIQLNDRLTVGAQPSVSQLERLREEGFRAIVNLRTEGEEDQPMSPEEERCRVEAAGLYYLQGALQNRCSFAR